MNRFRKFYTFNRICTLRNRTIQLVRQRKKFKEIKLPIAACSDNLYKQPVKNKSNLPVFNIHQCEIINSGAIRFFSSDKIDFNRYMISSFEVYDSPSAVFDVMKSSFQGIIIRLFVDSSFVPREFLESAEQAAKIVSKLISEKRLSELEGLVTTECLSKLTENIDNWVAIDRRDIAITDNDFVTLMPYNYKVVQGNY